MSEPTELHQRTVSLEIDRRGDGWSVHGELRDLRRIDLPAYLGVTHPAGVVHHMALDLAIDAARVIRAAKGWMGTAPFDRGPATNGEGCRDILPSYERLVGTRVDERYAAQVFRTVGGPLGCFHILSLAQCLPLALEAAIAHGRDDFRRDVRVRASADASLRLGMDGALRDEAGGRAEKHGDLTLWLGVPGFTVLDAHSKAASPAAEAIARLRGLTITKGFTAAALERLGGAAGSADLAALIIAVTPVVPQASGALAGLLKLSPQQKLRERSGNPQADTCHMWRSGGPLLGLGEGR
jgi:DUF2889 family protein